MADTSFDPSMLDAVRQALRELIEAERGREDALAKIALKTRLTVEEVALLLNTSKRTVYKRIEENKLRSHKDGDCRYILRADVEKYVAELDRQQNGKRPA